MHNHKNISYTAISSRSQRFVMIHSNKYANDGSKFQIKIINIQTIIVGTGVISDVSWKFEEWILKAFGVKGQYPHFAVLYIMHKIKNMWNLGSKLQGNTERKGTIVAYRFVCFQMPYLRRVSCLVFSFKLCVWKTLPLSVKLLVVLNNVS